MTSIIEQAIQQKRKLKLRYYGGIRVVEPYAFGVDRNGEALLMCYQKEDEGSSRRTNGWMFVRPDEQIYIQPLDESFARFSSGYIRNHPAFHTILVQA